MGVNQTLPSTHAFSSGADLWIVAPPEISKWALKIDWELNFQLLRASQHKRPQLAPELQDMIEKTGLTHAVGSSNNTDNSGSTNNPTTPHLQSVLTADSTDTGGGLIPLLVPAELNLPCRWVLCFKKWQASSMVKTWRELGSPTTRVFLPKSEDANAFVKQWESAGGDHLQLVHE